MDDRVITPTLKPFGIVRRLDDLGRVVIPKEIRRAVGNLKEYDPVEIFLTEDGGIYLKKYVPEEGEQNGDV